MIDQKRVQSDLRDDLYRSTARRYTSFLEREKIGNQTGTEREGFPGRVLPFVGYQSLTDFNHEIGHYNI